VYHGKIKMSTAMYLFSNTILRGEMNVKVWRAVESASHQSFTINTSCNQGYHNARYMPITTRISHLQCTLITDQLIQSSRALQQGYTPEHPWSTTLSATRSCNLALPSLSTATATATVSHSHHTVISHTDPIVLADSSHPFE
jgi:hypothetical protein